MLCQTTPIQEPSTVFCLYKSYTQVVSKLNLGYIVLINNTLYSSTEYTASYRQVNYAHIGMYLIYLGAVLGSNGLISFFPNTSFINRDILPAEVSGTPMDFEAMRISICFPSISTDWNSKSAFFDNR